MTGSGRGLGAVSAAVLVLHAALGVAVLAVAAEPLRLVLRELREPVVFADEQVSLAWLVPAAFVAAFLLARLTLFALGRRAGIAWTWAAIIALAATAAGRAVAPDRVHVGFTSLQAAPPTVQTVEAMKLLQARLNDGLSHSGVAPDADALQAPIEVDGRELIPAYSYRGSSRPFHVVVVPDANGPVDRVRPGDLPGTIYAALSADRRRYWVTAVVLIDDPAGRSTDLLPGPDGVYVLSNG